MTDITGPLNELRAAYRAFQNAKRDKKEEIREKYESLMADEVRKAVDAEKRAFANLLRDRKDFYDLRVSDIQDHVLRTRNWKVWEDLRDYAAIEPERVTVTNAKEAAALAKSPFRWASDYSTLTVLRNSKGADVNPVTYDMSTNYFHTGSRVWFPAPTDEAAERAAARSDSTPTTWARFVSDEIQAAIDAGHVKS
jgi:hypothetical protein